MTFFSYVVRWDHGFAPNPFFGLCSLATCKPGIRKKAKIGDWVLGTGSAEHKLADRAIFLMRVDGITTFDAYWKDFPQKRATLNGSFKVRFGDNIYHRANDGAWIQEDSRHSQHGAKVNETNLRRDTGTTDRVLLGTTFTYWGDQAPQIPAQFTNFHIGRPGYTYRFTEAEVAAFLAWTQGLGQSGRVGDPVDWRFADRW